MRSAVLILIFSFFIIAMRAQKMKPEIVGQKQLSTQEGKAITIQLTDLYVEETPVRSDDDDNGNGEGDESGNGDNGGSGDDDGNDEGAGDNADKDEDDDDDKDDDEKEDEDKDDKDKKDEKDNDKGNKGDKDDRGDKGDKGGDKDDKGDKDGKGKKDDKGKKGGKGKDSSGGKYPDGYTLLILESDDYSFSSSSISPDRGFTGVLSVPVRVRNDTYTSPTYNLKITVVVAPTAPNQPPVIVGQSPLTTPMETPLEVKLSHLQVTDPDDQYPQGFKLNLQSGENYQVSGSTVTPADGFAGMLTVPVTVNDGKSNSTAFNLKITVAELTPENIVPKITGQLPLSVSVNQSVQITLTQLLVTDPDNEYPADFKLTVFPGTGYRHNGTIVTPVQNFSGDLTVNVSVSDGRGESEIFPFKITVTAHVNQKPVITGQAGLKIPPGESLEIKLSHLVIEDPDNRYPEDFTLLMAPGENYSVSNHTITPDAGFLGNLTVAVSVYDGKAESNPFGLKIQVISGDKLEIVGQKTIHVQEDSSTMIGLNDLVVYDPSHTYPDGYTLYISSGAHYQVNHNQIVPSRDFSGNLTVPITVKHGHLNSAPFHLLIVVTPVNDPPELINIPSDPLVVNPAGPSSVFPGATIVDVDDGHLLFAEIGFRDGSFSAEHESLDYVLPDSLHVVFDESTGVLYAVGRGSLREYQNLIQSVTYHFRSSTDSLPTEARHIYVKLNDGKSASIEYERLLMYSSDAELQVPSAFTPNNDNANDTWAITPLADAEQVNTFIRVYDKNGNMVFQSNNLQQAWDGYYNGSPLPADVYFYTIEVDLSYRKITHKGIVSILR